MAFQQQGGAGGGGPGEHHAPQGTEYTLQGVMRFLQLEWHSHERARNAWEIERQEMKAKVAKQEGEVRQAKRINEQLERQVKMLEGALRRERAKGQKLPNGEAVTAKEKGPEQEGVVPKGRKRGHERGLENGTHDEEHRRKHGSDTDDAAQEVLTFDPAPSTVPHNSFLETDDSPEQADKEREQYLDNTTKYLKSCMKEIQYLLTPPPHPPPQQMLSNGNYSGLPDPPLSVEDIYLRNQQQRAAQRQQAQALAPVSAVPNHQPPPVPQPGGQQLVQNTYREYPDIVSQPALDNPQQQGIHQVQVTHDDQVESITHTFDADGRAIPDAEALQPQHQIRQVPDPDGWTFDDEQPLNPDTVQPEVLPPRRPDTDLFPTAAINHLQAKSPPRGPASHRRKSSGAQAMSRRRSSQGKHEGQESADALAHANDPTQFKVKFALRGHLDVVRSVIFSGGGSPSEPEVCTCGDDGTIKRWIIPASYQNYNHTGNSPDLDIGSQFTHRGHEGVVTCLASCPPSTGFSTGGRTAGDGWIFSGGQDATVKVWERGRVDPKATLEGHTDAVWCVCVLPASVGAVFGQQSSNFGGPDRLLLVSGAADGTIKVWATTAPPQSSSPATGSRRGVGGSRRHSVTSVSNFPSSPQPSVASLTQFGYTLIHTIERPASATEGTKPSPTCIAPLAPSGETFVVSYTDSSVLVFDTRTGEEVIGMASSETYDGTMNSSINAVVATSLGLEGTGPSIDAARGLEAEEVGAGATGGREGVEGVVISGHEDRFVRFFDANSGQCTYTMLAHPAAISSLCLSKDGREAVSAGHDASIRFWSLEKRICTQDIVSHRSMRGEGVCCVCWSQDGRLVVSAGGDGVVKVFAR
ncbi:1,2-dihydroxy-3-keto-5-methylthiopentene dioxygenase [Recurvomyces mirabilis]|uniref:1,2-dihydroxy-3-keto-5-methylthiopentene dioxygenase n=1 Tax=Recurvomyces mirabilis TaxID=574656 RepID=A0AAE1C330_9PEZI|nr:1,2-dihydroxy-3-keto-5-methylthiopentene dioxygenase [Recurvomyces mirabilis]KAK5154705.1 1,2-dihydroxy-3-keto-5-methylthiopentene dioxygenase [Recurvomyces mirabilis]